MIYWTLKLPALVKIDFSDFSRHLGGFMERSPPNFSRHFLPIVLMTSKFMTFSPLRLLHNSESSFSILDCDYRVVPGLRLIANFRLKFASIFVRNAFRRCVDGERWRETEQRFFSLSTTRRARRRQRSPKQMK